MDGVVGEEPPPLGPAGKRRGKSAWTQRFQMCVDNPRTWVKFGPWMNHQATFRAKRALQRRDDAHKFEVVGRVDRDNLEEIQFYVYVRFDPGAAELNERPPKPKKVAARINRREVDFMDAVRAEKRRKRIEARARRARSDEYDAIRALDERTAEVLDASDDS